MPHFLYVDEFQNCQTSKFDELLSMAGGYGLRLCLANQFVGQLEERVRKAVFGNVSSYVIFCVGDEETRYFRSIAQPYNCEDLAHFPKYRALFKIAGEPEAVIKDTLPIPPLTHPSPAAYIRNRTIERYGWSPRQEPQAELESKQDGGSTFTTNEGKTRGPKRPR